VKNACIKCSELQLLHGVQTVFHGRLA